MWVKRSVVAAILILSTLTLVRAQGDPPPAEKVVYITRTGKKYHTKDCSYVRGGAYEIKLSDAKKKGYTPCSKCDPGE